jgi:hypothetical protein
MQLQAAQLLLAKRATSFAQPFNDIVPVYKSNGFVLGMAEGRDKGGEKGGGQLAPGTAAEGKAP